MANRTLNLDATLYDYLLSHSLREHPAQMALREATKAHPHGVMQIGPDQGQFMAMLVRLIGARRTIEIGVFTGYSALTVALALPDDGYVLACDVSDEYTRIGRAVLAGRRGRAQDRPADRAREVHARRAACRGRCGPVRFRVHRRRQGEL